MMDGYLATRFVDDEDLDQVAGGCGPPCVAIGIVVGALAAGVVMNSGSKPAGNTAPPNGFHIEPETCVDCGNSEPACPPGALFCGDNGDDRLLHNSPP